MSDQAKGISSSIQIKKLGYTLYLHLPDNRLECRASYIPNDEGSMLTHEELIGYLNQHYIREGTVPEALESFEVRAAAGQPQKNILLASGIAPVNGEDEYIEMLVAPPQKPDADENSSVDMYLIQTFLNISEGEKIGRVIPATSGTPGRNIMGQPMQPQPGKPMVTRIGKNILRDEGSNLLIAATDGRVCQSVNEITVEDKYSVRGNVNFRVGSINFNGVVDVSGDVQDNFNITASKGLIVAGNIGVCNIQCGGNIVVCGVDGRNRGEIICEGTLRANFLHNVAVKATGDIIVGVEILGCDIKTLGKVIVDKGSIAGGSCIALKGIEAKKLGTTSSLHTSLHAGGDYRDLEEIDRLAAALNDELLREVRLKDSAEIAESRMRSAEIEASIALLKDKRNPDANGKINVKTSLFENIQLTIGKATVDIKEKTEGAKTFIENSVDGGIRELANMTSLNILAKDIETAYIKDPQINIQPSVTLHHESARG